MSIQPAKPALVSFAEPVDLCFWLVRLMARSETKVAAATLANKTARMIWAIMITGERYHEPLLQTV
jgi:hypothetical protein